MNTRTNINTSSVCKVSMTTRFAYVLTLNTESDRARSCEDLLKKIGFIVTFVNVIPHADPVISNKKSMEHIYEMVRDLSQSDQEFSYIFEDDIATHSDIKLSEIVKYERLSDMFFYLGVCIPLDLPPSNQRTGYSILGYPVLSISGNVRGLHAIALSRRGARHLLDFAKNSTHNYMDMILNDFSLTHPANIVRYDLESYIPGHRGMFFQDRKKYPSSIPDEPSPIA